MNKSMGSFFKGINLYQPYRNWITSKRQSRELAKWEKGGRVAKPVPHLIKQQVLKEFAERYSLKNLVETGTLHGDMVAATKDSFDMVYSIELSRELHEKAKDRFKADNNVEIIQGDSGEEMASLVTRLKGATLFWLDGHYSGGDTARGEEDTPIYKELAGIMAAGEAGHVIIIDDARLFGTDPAYPTVEELKNFVSSKGGDFEFSTENDGIRLVPSNG